MTKSHPSDEEIDRQAGREIAAVVAESLASTGEDLSRRRRVPALLILTGAGMAAVAAARLVRARRHNR